MSSIYWKFRAYCKEGRATMLTGNTRVQKDWSVDGVVLYRRQIYCSTALSECDFLGNVWNGGRECVFELSHWPTCLHKAQREKPSTCIGWKSFLQVYSTKDTNRKNDIWCVSSRLCCGGHPLTLVVRKKDCKYISWAKKTDFLSSGQTTRSTQYNPHRLAQKKENLKERKSRKI